MTPEEIAKQITGRIFKNKPLCDLFIVVSADPTEIQGHIRVQIYHINSNTLNKNELACAEYWQNILEHKSMIIELVV